MPLGDSRGHWYLQVHDGFPSQGARSKLQITPFFTQATGNLSTENNGGTDKSPSAFVPLSLGGGKGAKLQK